MNFHLLPPRQRAALILRDVLGYSTAEAAMILETSEQSVASAVKDHQAFRELVGQGFFWPRDPVASRSVTWLSVDTGACRDRVLD